MEGRDVASPGYERAAQMVAQLASDPAYGWGHAKQDLYLAVEAELAPKREELFRSARRRHRTARKEGEGQQASGSGSHGVLRASFK